MIKKISITGPESTGKSTLAQALAEHYQTVWVPEYARSYLDSLGREYTKDDLVEITKGQIKAEDEMEKKASGLLICDTDLLVIKIWHQHRFGQLHPLITDNYKRRSYDFYLLMDIDLPWKYDPQREHPHLRQYFFDLYERELRKMGVQYAVISGENRFRLRSAITAIDKFLKD
jgi:NadR type nicotinamide-nucleotide adenylyltransferase